jgi:cell division protein FtsL
MSNKVKEKCTLKDYMEVVALMLLVWTLVYLCASVWHIIQHQDRTSAKVDYIFSSLEDFDLNCEY